MQHVSWIKAEEAKRAAQTQRPVWTGEAWRDHRSAFKAQHYALAASMGVPYVNQAKEG